MTEYIDRDAVLRDWPLCDEPADAYHFIRGFPAADVVEVVRCKDCINHRQSGLCEGWSRYGTINTPDDAFCSWGVKIDV